MGRQVFGITGVAAAIVLVLGAASTFGQGSGARVPEPPPLSGQKPFHLTLEETKKYSRAKNFEVVGHNYFKGDWVTPSASKQGMGCGFNVPRVYKGIGYFAGYDDPPTCFGVLIADVSNPANMKVLSVIPCNPGTRCSYIRLNTSRKILVVGMDTSKVNPKQPEGAAVAQAGFSFYDVSDPRAPRLLGFHLTMPHGATHGFEIDDRYVYGCATTAQTKPANHEVVILDYHDPQHPSLVSEVHIQGQYLEESYEPRDQKNLDGSPQHIWCHEINYHKDRLYVAWRDAGMVIVDVSDRANPKIISRLDYVPPFHGGPSGATHTVLPVVTDPNTHPTLVVLTDEIIACPPGFGRIVDISYLPNPQVLATLRIPHVTDNVNSATGKFSCPSNGEYIHHPRFDLRSSSLLYTGMDRSGSPGVGYLQSLPAARGGVLSLAALSGAIPEPAGPGSLPRQRHGADLHGGCQRRRDHRPAVDGSHPTHAPCPCRRSGCALANAHRRGPAETPGVRSMN